MATLVRRRAPQPTGRAVLYVHGFVDYFFQCQCASMCSTSCLPGWGGWRKDPGAYSNPKALNVPATQTAARASPAITWSRVWLRVRTRAHPKTNAQSQSVRPNRSE